MIPVALRLKNFMSYGDSAPELDFEQFRVACLSGKNGQGKSALLDAITWSLWGEARKSSGSQKPDDELLRIGEREMQVEFVFDLEGERYRVVRSYTKSASGKTSRPGLEIHMMETSVGDYRPLTGSSIRETQQHIDAILGIDYDTFINSAFLLQGRSDEFTKKRPSERKEILARILNLGRYERLYELAAEKEREAKKEQEQAEIDIARLKEAIAPEPEWKAQRIQVETSIAEDTARLESARKEVRCLTDQLVELDARAREAAVLKQSIEALQKRLDQQERDTVELQSRIRQAEDLIAQRETIQQGYDRFMSLHAERNELDTKNELFRGIEKQIEQRETDLRDQKNGIERQLDKWAIEKRALEQQRTQCEAQLVEMPVVERMLKRAQAARREAEEMDIVFEQRKLLADKIRATERTLLAKREVLQGKLNALEEQVRRERDAVADISVLEAKQEKLQQDLTRRQALQAELEAIRVKGQSIGEDLHAKSGVLATQRETLAQLEEQIERLGNEAEGLCPTCGTELTPAHRKEVRSQFQRRLDGVSQEIQRLHDHIDQRKQVRDQLRESFREKQAALEVLADVPEQIAQVDEQIRRTRERIALLGEQEAELSTLQQTLETKSYGEEEREQYKTLKQQHDGLHFDETAYNKVRDEAAQVARYEDRLRQIEEAQGRKGQLEKSLEKLDQDADALRKTLDDGSAFGPLRQQIQQLKEQLAKVGFDQQRFRAVKQALEDLSDAGNRMTALVHAQQNHAEWKERLAQMEERMDSVRLDIETKQTNLKDVESHLGGKQELEVKLKVHAQMSTKIESGLHDLQRQLGQLSQMLEQVARDRLLLKQRRQDHAEAKNQRSLYRTLKAAFGKHGIPSLIIEQTLPEIEDRTNDLLERLTDGKMHVRLETLKDKKTGGTKETLDIKITDEQGVSRPYETFSGGEAFRVNFALRIALSQLLAERSGVRIRTLVIDEGFGTQDQQGIENLVDAIQVIKDDFEKIVVITHLPELKEVFPVRIEVEKDPVSGSHFQLHGV